MTRKTLLTLASVMTLSFQTPMAFADNHAKAMPDINTQFEVQHDIREADRRAIVASNLRLSDEESEKFWPLYDTYRSKIKDQEKATQNMLVQVAKTFGNIPKDQAETMVGKVVDLEGTVYNIRKDHILELKPVLSGAKYLRYFQIDTRLDAMFRYQLTTKIPLVPAEDNGITVLETSE